MRQWCCWADVPRHSIGVIDMATVCETCIEALEEEGVPEGAEVAMAIDLGADIADHYCDQVASDGDIQCACSCHPRKRGASQRMTGIDHDGIDAAWRKLHE